MWLIPSRCARGTNGRLTQVNGATLVWDDAGNLLQDQNGTQYTYAVTGRMVQVEQAGTTYRYQYNGRGDRLAQSVDGQTTQYTLDMAAGLTQVLVAHPDAGGNDGTNAYLYGRGRIGEEGAPLKRDVPTAGWAYHLPDALGSVRQLAGANGDVTLAQSYKPFGELLESAGVESPEPGFTGEWHEGTHLIYLRARYYDPRTGRFLTEDPASGYMAIPRSLHIYVYAWNNPVNLRDPSGRQINPMECAPGQICAGGTVGGQVTSSAWVVPINLGSSYQGVWEILTYRRSSYFSFYLETGHGASCDIGPLDVGLEHINGVSVSGANIFSTARRALSDYYSYKATGETHYAQYYDEWNLKGGVDVAGFGVYGEASVDVMNGSLNLVAGVEAELGPVGLATEMGLDTVAVESTIDPLFFYDLVNPVTLEDVKNPLSTPLTGGVQHTSQSVKYILVPSNRKNLWPNPNDLALNEFPWLVGREEGDQPHEAFWFEDNWKYWGQTHLSSPNQFMYPLINWYEYGPGGPAALMRPPLWKPYNPEAAWW